MLARWRTDETERNFYWSAMFEITWRRSARDSFLNAVSRLRNFTTCASSSLLFSSSASGRFDGDGGAVDCRCSDEWRARKMAPTRVILMSCGSYNPPTNMHLRMFEIARDHLHRMGTHVVVGGVISPVHDVYAKKELTSATHRCAMLRLALQNSDWIRLSTWETRQNCWTKTRICLQHHQNLLNSMLSNSNDIKHHLQIEDTDWIPENIKNSSDNTPIQIKLLCGADLLESFGICGLWLEEDIDAIVGEHGLVVITREGSNPNKFIYDSDILSKHMNNICIVTEWIPNEVSSTRIRRALKRGESVRYLLQDSVIDYIYKHEIYDVRMPDTTISDRACDVCFPGYNKTCMPTIRQIVDCLVATHPIRTCGPRLLLSAINSNRATNDFNQDDSMVASNNSSNSNNNNNNESAESYKNTRNPYHDHSYI